MFLRISTFILLASSVGLLAAQNFDDVKAKAIAGDAKAQNELGVMYRQGDGVSRDRAKAVEWYRKAALQKYPDALYNLGIAYFNGDGVASDELRAYAFLSVAKDSGSAEAVAALNQVAGAWRSSQVKTAKYFLADLVDKGVEIPQDEGKAYQLYREVAESGDPEAELKTCLFLEAGRGVIKNEEEAFTWCAKAGKNRPLDDLLFAIAENYERGTGRPVNYVAAERWYRFVASRKPEAAVRIAHLYKNNSLRSKEELLPEAYLAFAKEKGNEAATTELNTDLARFDKKTIRKLDKVTSQLSDELYKLRFGS